MREALVRYGRDIGNGLSAFADEKSVKDRRYVEIGFGAYAFRDNGNAGADGANG